MSTDGYSVWVELLFQGEISVQAESLADAAAQVKTMMDKERPVAMFKKIDAQSTHNNWLDHEGHVTGVMADKTRLNQ